VFDPNLTAPKDRRSAFLQLLNRLARARKTGT